MDNEKDIDFYLGEVYFASFRQRFFASLIDSLILGAITFLPFYIISGTSLKGMSLGYYVSIICFSFLYEVLQVYFFGMTIGKRSLKIKVVSLSGPSVSLIQSMLRSIFKYLSGHILYIGYLWMIRSELNQTWHDILANTIVVENETDDEVLAYLGNNPPEKNKWNKALKVMALVFTLIVFTYSSLDKLFNDIGDFGIEEIYSSEVTESFRHTKMSDVDNDGVQEIITLLKKEDSLEMNIYGWKENNIKLIEGFNLEETEMNIKKWDVADLDNDGIVELLLGYREDRTMKLDVYKRNNSKYSAIESMEYDDFEVLEDIDEKKHLAIYWKGNFETYSLINSKLVSNTSIKTDGIGGRFIKGDFDGDSIEDLYSMSRIYNERNYTTSINRIDYNDRLINLTPTGTIYLKPNLRLGYFKDRDPTNFMIEDINGDGRDDIVFEIEYSGNRKPWLNTFTLEDGKWVKIYSGGYMQSGEFGAQFLGKGDVNGDRIEELVMSGDAISAFLEER